MGFPPGRLPAPPDSANRVRRSVVTLPDASRFSSADPIAVNDLSEEYARQTASLLDDLHVSLFGIQSGGLHRALIADALAGRVDCRIATTSSQVCGTVIAAPRSYWSSALVRHPDVAWACARARLLASTAGPSDAPRDRGLKTPQNVQFESGPPAVTWTAPGNAWRIVIVGTAPDARGLGVGAALYRAIMRDRSLVARIAVDNEPSIRLHRALGWRLFLDGSVVLAVHLKRESA
jgi:GNAT superfamily N-acetyltransferase